MRAIIFVAFLALVAIVCADRNEFAKFKKKHGRKYRDNDHEERRYAHFKHNHDRIEKHNKGAKRSFTMGHNEFSDLSEEEFKQRFLPDIHIPTPRALPVATVPFLSAPAATTNKVSFKDYVLPVRSQSPCGCCWAFAASAQVESLLKRQNPAYDTHLSTQYLVDCAPSPNNGCSGGDTYYALKYLQANGLKADANYPFAGVKAATCNAAVPKIAQNITNVFRVSVGGNEQLLSNGVASVGPVVTLIQVVPSTFQLYKSGVYSDATCNNACTAFNHGVLLVGYDVDPTTGQQYWIIKNSWGPTWGDGGYIRMIKGGSGILNNNCNVACYADYAT